MERKGQTFKVRTKGLQEEANLGHIRREGDPYVLSTVLVTALSSRGKPVPRGKWKRILDWLPVTPLDQMICLRWPFLEN
jgi:hypothetical protein